MRKIILLVILLVLVNLTIADNIVVNSSFEIWLDTLGVHMPFGWLTSEINYPNSALKDTNSHTGNYCLKLRAQDTIAYATTITIIRPGYYYEFIGYANVPISSYGAFMLTFLSISGSPIGTPLLIPVSSSNGYRRYFRSFIAPDSAFFLSLSCLSFPRSEIYFDDVQVEDTSLGINENKKISQDIKTPLRKILVLNEKESKNKEFKNSLIFDPLGRKVFLSQIKKGIYFIFSFYKGK
ncbi:MAG: hypothetical protein ABIK90_06905 [candidate division WOR-3 bacterium]